MRYVSYTRSTSIFDFEGNPGKTIGVQNEIVEKYARTHGFKIIKKYSDRKHNSNERTSFDELFSDGIKRQFDFIIVSSIEYAANNLWVAKEVFLQTFYYAGLHFIVAEDDFNSAEKTDYEVEEYFSLKYQEYKSRLLSHRNIIYHKEHPKLIKKSKPSKDKYSQVISQIKCKMYDTQSGRMMNLRKIKGKSYFTVVDGINPYRTNCACRIEVDLAENMALMSLKQEKSIAIRVKKILESGAAETILAGRLNDLGNEMNILFKRVIENEITIEDAEKYFTEMTSRANYLEKAFSVTNPWISKMSIFPEIDSLTHEIVKKFVDKFFLTNYKDLTVQTLWNDWKMIFPEEWLMNNG